MTNNVLSDGPHVNELKPLKPKTGAPAEGQDYFYVRKQIINKIFNKLDNNENILISAPRRIGKTSILKHITRNPKGNQIIKYMIVQSADSSETFYKKVLNTLISDTEIYNLTKTLINRFSISAKAYISKVKGIKLDGVEISDYETLDYYELVSKVFVELSNQRNQIVLIFDEFPDAVANIYGNDEKAAIIFLQQHREFRELFSNSSLLFIYTGSTGLKNVVRKIGEIHLINNLVDIKIPPFSNNEAKELIQRLVLSRQQKIQGFNISDDVIDHILDKVTWLLPYYIQIIIEEI